MGVDARCRLLNSSCSGLFSSVSQHSEWQLLQQLMCGTSVSLWDSRTHRPESQAKHPAAWRKMQLIFIFWEPCAGRSLCASEWAEAVTFSGNPQRTIRPRQSPPARLGGREDRCTRRSGSYHSTNSGPLRVGWSADPSLGVQPPFLYSSTTRMAVSGDVSNHSRQPSSSPTISRAACTSRSK